MSEGLTIRASIPWALVGTAALGLAFMYRDVQNLKQSMVSAERIARCEARLDALEKEDAEIKDSVSRLWRRRVQ